MLLTGRRVCAQVDFMPVYAAHLRTIIQKGISHPSNYERPLEGFHIIVDAGTLNLWSDAHRYMLVPNDHAHMRWMSE